MSLESATRSSLTAGFRFVFGAGLLPAGILLALTAGCASEKTAAPAPKPVAAPVAPPLNLAQDGKTAYVIAVDAKASAPERHAAEELAAFLKQVTGAEFALRSPEEAGAAPRIAVGPAAAKATGPALSLDGLGADGIVIKAVPPHLVLTGGDGAPRGTLYAVYTFLEDQVGCRWWTRSESTIPTRPVLDIPAALDVRYIPPFERRDQCFTEGFDKDWSVRMKYNGWTGPGYDEARGSVLNYAVGMCHTFYPLVPPAEHFAKHPEWYSELNGKRTHEHAQLCLTNPELTAFVIEKAKEWLRKDPKATFISVTQNDWDGHCQCAKCKAIDDEEGSPAGTMIRFANAIADAIAPEFPYAAVDTFAYQYTRKPPKITKPRPNVIVRLCSIECDFAHPLESENNKAFRDDIENWGKICNRIYIWDYVTNFSNYMQPHPNLRVLGPNVRFFARNGVKGMFEQGNYQSLGGEFGALRAWVLGKLLWDPQLDDNALIDEFLKGYYGAAAPFVRRYIDMLHDRVAETGVRMGCFMPITAPYLDFKTMTTGEELFQQAEKAVTDQPELLRRVRIAHLPVRYILITRWPLFKKTAARAGVQWLGPATRSDAITEFEKVCTENNIKLLAEDAKRTIATLRNDFGDTRRENVPAPKECEGLAMTDWVDFQDDLFPPGRRGEWGDLKPDAKASDGMAAWMPGTHREWAVQLRLSDPTLNLQGQQWTAYVVVRVDKKADAGLAFTSGIYDTENKTGVADLARQAAEITDGEYHTYKLGDFAPTPAMYIWAAPPENPASIDGIWIDRFFLVRKTGK
ncbi:MAG: hypothetical protein A3K19_26620 [Lentisphaerae bacterium RIFOXYB12_FULL_65_16]|nr:MAG: hypothetical protein A3K18_18295 [Lentisphaerae bacterium RIFOXYA12_64_32]OGV86348.1 MAG: hypothetical protein A3K19_26620 [Lentisphaerae bacterium RIFOXYB12_FULL_65_16]